MSHAAQDYLRTGVKVERSATKSDSQKHFVFLYLDKENNLNVKAFESFLISSFKKKLDPSLKSSCLKSYKAQKSTIQFEILGQKNWILLPDNWATELETKAHNGQFEGAYLSRARDLMGSWLRTNDIEGEIHLDFVNSNEEAICGCLLGLGLASYKFLNSVKNSNSKRTWVIKNLKQETANRAEALFSAMNLARHLTNLPAEIANPLNIAQGLKKFFIGRPGVKIDIWNAKKLKQEKMGLLFGVGKGSVNAPCLVHLKYRPKNKSSSKKPLAFVGKGVTFDSGGLDIKPSSGMRLMKKDMAGAAAVAGLCHFVSQLELNIPCDFYLPLAENSVSDRATRPGDVHQSRSGKLVEIDNTDAEGRLVMADAISLALDQKTKEMPAALFDISTLTGAMRVAVGLDIAGYFSNNDKLAQSIDKAAVEAGEFVWRMPLLRKYSKSLNSSFADFKNSSDSGYGGAITAALFLEKFIKDVPWVHFDVMSWNMSGDGAISEGANAQCIQILAQYLLTESKR